jgi:hypothetical protein
VVSVVSLSVVLVPAIKPDGGMDVGIGIDGDIIAAASGGLYIVDPRRPARAVVVAVGLIHILLLCSVAAVLTSVLAEPRCWC